MAMRDLARFEAVALEIARGSMGGEVAAIFEDIGNRYIDVCDALVEERRARPTVEPSRAARSRR